MTELNLNERVEKAKAYHAMLQLLLAMHDLRPLSNHQEEAMKKIRESANTLANFLK